MILVFGGAYQGKLRFVAEKYGYGMEDIYRCNENDEIDFSKPVIADLGNYVLGMIRRGENPLEFVHENKCNFKDKIIVITDVGSGIVPMTKEQRLFRDNIGKITQILSRESDEVYRLFCGIGEKLK